MIGDTALAETVRVYVWEWPVRACHWLIAGSIAVLSGTGLYIANPSLMTTGVVTQRSLMGLVKLIHYSTAIVFGIAVFSRVWWMFVGNNYARWDKFVPARTKRWKAIWPTLSYYLFRMRKPPGFVGHNPLAGLTYTLVFVIYLIMIGTGLAMYSVSAHVGSPLRLFTFLVPVFGGLAMARWLHHGFMWMLIGFALHHVYSAVLMSQVEANATVESIFSGYKFVPREDLVYSGYRFIDRKDQHG
ncbi:MAG TPA: Ni/Fe-hydrogenase, b-type cytochrome subunit [Vicinamibacterales bacterium]|jgi:Ni/Fe-hydrogenase 1 B-type cytochrome subunit